MYQIVLKLCDTLKLIPGRPLQGSVWNTEQYTVVLNMK